jgi:hypothetical protein
MAADLTADIEEAESEGGSAEDVLGNSAFDPRRFAGSWAMARGVTSSTVLAPSPRRWPALAFGLLGCTALLALAVAVVSGGRQSAAAIASPVRRFVGGPPSIHVFPGAPFVVQRMHNGQGFALLAVLLLAISLVGIVVSVMFWSRWAGGRIGPLEIHRYRAGSGVPRT